MEEDRRPDWDTWSRMDAVTVLDAVSLSLNFDPRLVKRNPNNWRDGEPIFSETGEFDNRMLLTVRAVKYGSQLEVVEPATGEMDFKIRLPSFASWMVSMGKNIPQELERLAMPTPMERGSWPWGDYTTPLLGHLDAAARRYWINYDPNEGNANTKKVVVDWLTKKGCSQNEAEAIDLILRPKDLPRGPRR